VSSSPEITILPGAQGFYCPEGHGGVLRNERGGVANGGVDEYGASARMVQEPGRPSVLHERPVRDRREKPGRARINGRVRRGEGRTSVAGEPRRRETEAGAERTEGVGGPHMSESGNGWHPDPMNAKAGRADQNFRRET
jgi:hypothetical protein